MGYKIVKGKWSSRNVDSCGRKFVADKLLVNVKVSSI
jgi:hypothetical protein